MKSTKGSDTQALTTAKEAEATTRRSSWGLAITNTLKKLGSVADISNTALRAAVMKNPEAVYQKMKVDALLDPDLAKTLLLRPTTENLPLIQSGVNKYFNAYMAPATNENKGELKSRRQRILGE
jgi:hypothetical protein